MLAAARQALGHETGNRTCYDEKLNRNYVSILPAAHDGYVVMLQEVRGDMRRDVTKYTEDLCTKGYKRALKIHELKLTKVC